MRKSDRSLLASAASLLICGVLAGVVVAAAAFPAVALSGLAAKAGGDAFGQLPDELTHKQSPQISYVYASDNKTLIASMYDENRRNLALDEIPKIMQQAIIAAEDQKFYSHTGVDVKGIARAFVANKTAGDVEQGASTLTMQFVRLSISYSAETADEVIDATEDTPARKLREIKYAMQVEKDLGKDKILEGYLNTAYFGNRSYGVFAAAQVYFGKELKDLSLAQVALLAGLVKFPSTYNAESGDGKEKALLRRDYVLDEMAQTGAITTEQAAEAKKEELKVSGVTTPNGCVQATTNHWGFFCDFFQRWWMDQEVFGKTTYDRERQLKSGGYRIVTSLDIKIQDALQRSVNKEIKNTNPHALMLAGIEPGTGKVRSLAVNRVFKLDSKSKPTNLPATDPVKRRAGLRGSYPATTNPLITGGGDINGYQAGSVFKMTTMVAALEKGYPLDYTINAVNQYTTKFPVGGDSANCGGYWCPKNASASMAGVHNMWSGFGRSVNTFFAPLIERAGAQNAIDAAKRMGIVFRSDRDNNLIKNGSSFGAFTLGVTQSTPLDVANMFATLAADGVYCEPIPVEQIFDTKGNKLDVGNPRCKETVKPDVARAAIDAARCPIGDRSQYGKCAGSTYGDARDIVGKPLAGKSGTTDGSKVATMTMTTRQLAISGFLADPDWAETKDKMSHDIVNPAVAHAMRDAMKGKAGLQFNKPSRKIAFGTQVSIPAVTCKTIDEAKSILRAKGFDVEVEKGKVDSPCPAGTAAGTSPTGRTIADGIVMIQVSNGKKVATGPSKPPGGPNNPPGPGH